MVDKPVDHRCGDDVVGEDLAPAAEWNVRGDKDRALFVAGGDELEEEVRGIVVEGDVADLVDDEQLVAAKATQFLLEPTGCVPGSSPSLSRKPAPGKLVVSSCSVEVMCT